MSVSSPPTSEQGRVSDLSGDLGSGLLAWGAFTDEAEYVPEFTWPSSIQTVDRMLTDGQVSSLMRSVGLPLQRRAWALDPNDADEESVNRLADELNLPILDDKAGPSRRRRGRFSHKRHLVDALRALAYGHYYFEQVGVIEDGRWVLKKLAPRPPRTINEINVADDGGLVSIKQATGLNAKELSVDRLVAYVFDQEAGNWAGRSMIRSCYKNWLIKDRLLRVDAIKHERSGMGIPWMTAAPGATPEQIEQMGGAARASKVVEQGGGAGPAGSKMELIGTSGTLPDTVGSMRFHNEEMAASFLAMFKQLGQTQTGSRALGETMIDFFSLALDAVGEWYLDVFNQHVIEDWYDWNYGEESQPALLCVEEEADPEYDVAPLQNEIDQGNLQVDNQTATEVGATARPSRHRSRGGKKRRERAQATADSSGSPSLSLPPRPLRREPYTHEVQATTDYAIIDASLNAGIDQSVQAIRLAQKAQIGELHDLIVDAGGDLAALARLEATPIHGDVILAAMQKSADMGIDQAASEASRQGVAKVKRPGLDELESRLTNRALATDQLLADDLAGAAVRHSLRLTGEGTDAAVVASQVSEHLGSLSTKYLEDRMNGALTSAMNDGRKTTMAQNKASRVYSSELLDENTCESCAAVDGTQYENVDESTGDYPTGGYFDCQGFERCRGTLVAVYNEGESPEGTTINTPEGQSYSYPGAGG